MSLVFNDTSTFRGLVQIYEKEIGADQGDISGNTARLKAFTADVNLALDDLVAIAMQADGTWQFDDTNQTDYPEITKTLTSGTRRYAFSTFTADAGGNLMLEIFKVFIKNPSGTYVEIKPVDVQTQDGLSTFTDGLNAGGQPTRYDKTGGWIDLDPVPNYTISAGIKLLINREASYFVYTDTTKKAGVSGTLHRYLAIKPAYDYARIHSLDCEKSLLREVLMLEKKVGDVFSKRTKDESRRITARQQNNK